MVFKSDKQRKGFFAQKGKARSNIIPSISGKIQNIKEKLRQRRERLGRERIEKEKVLLKQEKEQAKRLTKEAEIAVKREKIAQQRKIVQQKLRETTFVGKIQKSIKEREQRRKEFTQSPKGQALLKRQAIERKKTIKKAGKFIRKQI